MSHDWIKVTIYKSPEILEEISPALFDMGCQGINELENRFQLFFEQKDWNDQKSLQLFEFINKYTVIQSTDILTENLPSEDWNENWKQNFKSFRVGKNIIIQPDWEMNNVTAKETVITIAPKMAFGTGHHETTQLILQMMENIIEPGMAVLDAGTGSAILAIYAALKGAKPIHAFDNDPQAIENASENCALNKVAENIKLTTGVLSDIIPRQYDLILANINRNILLDMASQLTLYSKKDTLLILSGLLVSDKNEIVKGYQQEGWHLQNDKQQGEWIGLLMRYNK